MDKRREFIRLVNEHVRRNALDSTVSRFSEISGHAMDAELDRVARWFAGLDPIAMSQVSKVIEYAVDSALFNMLTLIDGAATDENENLLAPLELYWDDSQGRVLLNDPDGEDLHSLLFDSRGAGS